MRPLLISRLAEITGGTLADVQEPDLLVSGPAAIDSRRVTTGSLFVALQGERVDGHDFAATAAAAGAALALTTRPVGVPALVVPEVLAALDAIAHASLAALPDVTVIALTGSAGKTTTKDLVAALLRRLGPTVATPDSFNNEIGHPYSVLLADASTRYLVLEMGARGPGHIAARARISPPRVGAVLNVGSAHVGEFGSREGIAAAKGELVEALPAAADGGVAILNADDPLVAGMAGRTEARVVTAGTASGADVRAEAVTTDARGRATYTLATRSGQVAVRLGLVGAHQVANSLIAAAVAIELGLPLAGVADGLAEAVASKWRMEITERSDGVTVINDAYNANPESVAAALHALTAIAAGRRAVAVLGEMAELGAGSAAAHRDVGALAAELGVAVVVAVGPNAAPIADAAGDRAVRVADIGAAIDALKGMLEPRDVVLVKGSRVVGLERVAAALDEHGATNGNGETAR
ncbi:MAG: UDP-N-acetylmuramoyl-tripeptide--D-alanyl-D-alanine ligase [Mycobacteriales bacterium]